MSASVAPTPLTSPSTGLAGVRRAARWWRRWRAVAVGAIVGVAPSAPDRVAGPRDGELARAIARGELRLAYQPKLHLRSQRIASLEALVRWQHPERGLILPGDFIPAAEKTDDILALSLWVVAQAIADQQVLAMRGHDLPIFVNIAADLLANQAFIDRACAMIQAGGTRIGLEITETSVIRDPEAAIANLQRAAGLGIPVAIDDYGAGLSSLAYLKKLPACELKIDKLFITELTSSNRDPLIVRSTIDLAHAMEMEVVAEGVETQAALALLSVMGCDMAQGYHISRPVAFDQVTAFLDRHREGWMAAEGASGAPRWAVALKRA